MTPSLLQTLMVTSTFFCEVLLPFSNSPCHKYASNKFDHQLYNKITIIRGSGVYLSFVVSYSTYTQYIYYNWLYI